jgi:hypothetical protein
MLSTQLALVYLPPLTPGAGERWVSPHRCIVSATALPTFC